ncbi:MAG TPA: multiprotein bridging factor aMBF1 [Candidatus Krumholzibacteriaceae bacterium]|jgi:putative transcription factor|nr:multiprotein bridging factor aMBF1 [Candidatus Krumholzibacteriaceae bacterium]
MQCEVCGRKIIGKQYKAIIEGAIMLVCSECEHYGSRSWEAETAPKPKPMPALKPRLVSPPVPSVQKTVQEAALELVEDYPKKIRQAREKLGLTHEDLGRKINERVSLLKKIETGKMTPTQSLAEKLQHVLRIKLLAPAMEVKVPQKVLTAAKTRQEFTLGDLIKEKKTEETRARK